MCPAFFLFCAFLLFFPPSRSRKHSSYVNGELRSVYSYTEADRPLLEEAFWLVHHKQSPDLTPYLTRSKKVCVG
jgi:hypothetical protein